MYWRIIAAIRPDASAIVRLAVMHPSYLAVIHLAETRSSIVVPDRVAGSATLPVKHRVRGDVFDETRRDETRQKIQFDYTRTHGVCLITSACPLVCGWIESD